MNSWRNKSFYKEKLEQVIRPGAKIIVFDTETTGLQTTDKIIQFSAVKYLVLEKGFKEIDKIDLYINPEEPLSPKIIEITGITDEVLKYARTEEYEASDIHKFMMDAHYWFAYNIAFDIRMMMAMFQRTGFPCTEKPCFDVLAMARDMIPKGETENYKLATVTEYLFPNASFEYHSSIEDVRATAKCLAYFVGQYKKFDESEDDDKIQTTVERAFFVQNPYAKSQVRIKLKLLVGEDGDIFWDVPKKCWSCKTTSSAKALFQRLNMKNIEEQVLAKYGWKYHAKDMETLAKNWQKEKKSTQ